MAFLDESWGSLGQLPQQPEIALGAPIERRTQDPKPSLFLMAPEFWVGLTGDWGGPFAVPCPPGTEAGRGPRVLLQGERSGIWELGPWSVQALLRPEEHREWGCGGEQTPPWPGAGLQQSPGQWGDRLAQTCRAGA